MPEEVLGMANESYRFHVANLLNDDDTECVRYLLANRGRILPELIAMAENTRSDIETVVEWYIREFHEGHVRRVLERSGRRKNMAYNENQFPPN